MSLSEESSIEENFDNSDETMPENVSLPSEEPPAEITETSDSITDTDLSDFNDPLCILAVLPEKIEIKENAGNASKTFADNTLSEEMRDKLQNLVVRLEKEGMEKTELDNCLYEMVFYWNDMVVEYLYFSKDEIVLNFTADDGYSRYESYSWAESETFLKYLKDLMQ